MLLTSNIVQGSREAFYNHSLRSFLDASTYLCIAYKPGRFQLTTRPGPVVGGRRI